MDALVDEAVGKVEAMCAHMPTGEQADFLEDVAAMLEASVDKLRGDDWERESVMTSEADWQKWYRALKQERPDAYKKAIEYTEGVTLKFGVPSKAAADYEVAAVLLACDLLGISP